MDTGTGLQTRVPSSAPLGTRRARACPASFSQAGMWLTIASTPRTAAYNSVFAYSALGQLDIPAFKQALRLLVQRHESLRTVFQMRDSLMQVVLEDIDIPLHVVHGCGRGYDEEATRHWQQELEHAFDLEQGPLLRVSLVPMAPSRCLLFFNVHRLIADFWSVGILTRELAQLYGSTRLGRGDPLPALPLQLADVALRQRHLARTGGYSRQLAYWRDRLAGAPAASELPGDAVRPRLMGPGAAIKFSLPAGLAEQIHDFARRRRMTPYPVLLGALHALLHRYTGRCDLIIGSPVANRTRTDLESVMGFLVNTLPMRADLSGDPPFETFVARLWSSVLQGFAHQDVPFEKLVEDLKPARQGGRSPWFQIVFSLDNTRQHPLTLAGLEVERLPAQAVTAIYDLVFALIDGASLDGEVTFATALFRRETIEGLIADYRAMLDGAMREPQLRISALPLGSRAGRMLVASSPDASTPASAGAAEASAEPAGVLTSTEETVRDVWTGVLGVSSTTRDESFFDLGGHSFLAIQVITRLRELFAVELGLLDFFDSPTIRGQAATIDRLSGAAAAHSRRARAITTVAR